MKASDKNYFAGFGFAILSYVTDDTVLGLSLGLVAVVMFIISIVQMIVEHRRVAWYHISYTVKNEQGTGVGQCTVEAKRLIRNGADFRKLLIDIADDGDMDVDNIVITSITRLS